MSKRRKPRNAFGRMWAAAKRPLHPYCFGRPGGGDPAWEATLLHAIGDDRGADFDDREVRSVLLDALARSRVIVFSTEQAQAFASMTREELSAVCSALRAPFPRTLLDLGVPKLPAALVIDHDTGPLQVSRLEVIRGHDMIIGGHLDENPPIFDHAAIADMVTKLAARVGFGGTPDEIVDEWVSQHAMIAGPLAMLESVNVELVEAPYPAGHRAAQQPRYEVRVRQSSRRYKGRGESQPIDWTHRWEVRGNFAHHFEETLEGNLNKVFARAAEEHPEKIIKVDGRDCVRVWRPPYVKGPDDKPLLPKVRVAT